MSRALRRAAKILRQIFIKMGVDRLVGTASGRLWPHWLWARLRPDITYYRRPTVRRVVRDGIKFDLDLSDYMQWCVYYSVEHALRKRLYALVRAGDVAIDVGTNVGEVLLNFARLTSPGGRAIGFEPNPTTHARCVANIALNVLNNVEVHRAGVGAVEGQFHLGRRSMANSGQDALMAAGANTIEVAVTTLDRFAEAGAVARVNLIKIDVEGYEMHVLRGAEATLRKHRPTMFIELCDDNLREQGDSAAELVRHLELLDYSIRDAESGAPVTSSDNFAGCFLDIVCQPVC